MELKQIYDQQFNNTLNIVDYLLMSHRKIQIKELKQENDDLKDIVENINVNVEKMSKNTITDIKIYENLHIYISSIILMMFDVNMNMFFIDVPFVKFLHLLSNEKNYCYYNKLILVKFISSLIIILCKSKKI